MQAISPSTAQSLGRVPPAVPVPRFILPELDGLDVEFGEWQFDRPSGLLSVVTEPIVLRNVVLGPFRIELELRDLGNGRGPLPLRVIALEPNPATGDERITHPHVSNDQLCTGEATMPIRNALEQGRLCDALVLVRSVLNNYNPESPYVELESWDGVPCADCGDRIHDDEQAVCDRCEETYCTDCIGRCRVCDADHCHGCLQHCRSCDDPACPTCLKRCGACERRVCSACLEDDLCPDCYEQEEGDTEPDAESDTINKDSPDHEPIPTTQPPPTPAPTPASRTEIAQAFPDREDDDLDDDTAEHPVRAATHDSQRPAHHPAPGYADVTLHAR